MKGSSDRSERLKLNIITDKSSELCLWSSHDPSYIIITQQLDQLSVESPSALRVRDWSVLGRSDMLL